MKKIERIKDLRYNLITDTDSYKFSHAPLIPAGTTYVEAYFEARGGEYDECTLFGMQYVLHAYLSTPVEMWMVEEAKEMAEKHGEPFPYDQWKHIVDVYGGKLPVKIRAIPEGTVVKTSNVVFKISCNDRKCLFIVGWVEALLERLWYPSTIAISSREYKKLIYKYLKKSSLTPDTDILFSVNDFSARGVSCLEQSRIGSGAHLLSFLGTDTFESLRWARNYYSIDMAGFSIPATEHFLTSIGGKEGEYKFFIEFVDEYLVKRQVPAGIPKLAACVSDTYNIYDAVRFWCRPEVRKKIRDAGGTLIIRPDSGPPVEVLTKIFNIFEEELGSDVNLITIDGFEYKVLPSELRVIQGDGIDRKMVDDILHQLVDVMFWSATNINFGSGGGLIQKHHRDEQKWAYKCCAALVNDVWRDVRKEPITDPGKRSKAGRLDLIKINGEYTTVVLPEGVEEHENSVMNTVFYMGDIYYHNTFEECRERMKI